VDGESWREVDGEKSMKKDSFNYDSVSSMSFHYFRKTLCHYSFLKFSFTLITFLKYIVYFYCLRF
jgi:hypothetical protein